MLKYPAASVRARLFAHAKQHGYDYQRILTQFAIERLLFRLGRTEAARHYVLKGAMLFATWPEHALRPTRDLDLLGEGDSDPIAISELFARICRVECPEDGIRFEPTSVRTEPLREADKYQGVRLTLSAELAGAVISVLVDIGFGDHVYPPPKRQIFPGLLPNLPTANILMYPPETVVAEKFEAMIRFGEVNSRVKDFYDIWIAARTFRFDLSTLVEAIGGTLRRRETAIPTGTPVGLTDVFAVSVEKRGLWSGFLRRNPPTLAPPPFAELQEELRRFFGPVIVGLGVQEDAHGRWDPQDQVWRQGQVTGK